MKAKDTIREAIEEARLEKPGVILPAEDIYNAIFKAGIKEVVEWVMSNGNTSYIYEGTYTYDTKCANQLMLDLGDLQAQLKEWGIKVE